MAEPVQQERTIDKGASMKIALGLLISLLGAGCADTQVVSSQSDKVQLVVERVQPDGPIGIEGSVSFARIEREDGSVVTEEGFDAPEQDDAGGRYGSKQLELNLEPGTYTLVSYQRTCDGTCDSLDPPDDDFTCQHPIEVEEGTTLTAEVRVLKSDCEIELSVVSP